MKTRRQRSTWSFWFLDRYRVAEVRPPKLRSLRFRPSRRGPSGPPMDAMAFRTRARSAWYKGHRPEQLEADAAYTPSRRP